MRLRFGVRFGVNVEVGRDQPEMPALKAGDREHADAIVLYGRPVRPSRAQNKPRWLPIEFFAEHDPIVRAAKRTDGAGVPNQEAVDVVRQVHKQRDSTPPEPPLPEHEEGRS